MDEINDLFDKYEANKAQMRAKREELFEEYEARRAEAAKVMEDVILPVLKDAEHTIKHRGYHSRIENDINLEANPNLTLVFDTQEDVESSNSRLSFFFRDKKGIEIGKSSDGALFANDEKSFIPVQEFDESKVKEIIRAFVAQVLEHTLS